MLEDKLEVFPIPVVMVFAVTEATGVNARNDTAQKMSLDVAAEERRWVSTITMNGGAACRLRVDHVSLAVNEVREFIREYNTYEA